MDLHYFSFHFKQSSFAHGFELSVAYCNVTSTSTSPCLRQARHGLAQNRTRALAWSVTFMAWPGRAEVVNISPGLMAPLEVSAWT